MSEFYSVLDGRLEISPGLPAGMLPLINARSLLAPEVVATLCANLRAWEGLRLSPGPLLPQNLHVGAKGRLAVHFAPGGRPRALMVNAGLAPDIAAWLVVLDRLVGTEITVAQARTVWSAGELAQALPFVTPAFLPAGLLAWSPDNWERVARALARVAAGDGGAGA